VDPEGTVSRTSLGGAIAVLVIAVLLGIPGPTALGQEAQTREDVLQSLLVEVRGLRAAMEQMSAAGPRVQLAMGRLQIQEQRLTAARRRLDDVRDGIANAEREAAEARDRLPMMEDAALRMAEPAEREAVAGQLKLAKAMLAQKSADVQRLREQEAELVGVVGTEEGRWTEISQRLDDLERALAPRR
jgi:chromosome segregation ATPase